MGLNDTNELGNYTDTVGNHTVSFTYDNNGSRTLRHDSAVSGNTTYAYDYENRLVTLAVPSGGQGAGNYTYAYDYRTRRVLRDESAAGGNVTNLVFSGGASIREYTGNVTGTPVAEFIRGSDWGGGVGGVLYSLRTGAASYYHYDGRGDVVAQTNSGHSLTYQAAYEAFGKHNTAPGTQEYGSSTNRQRANTKDEDPTGLLDEGFRYRDLDTGTFLTRDPAGFVDGPNLYTYVLQDPWTKFDPEGLAANDTTDDDSLGAQIAARNQLLNQLAPGSAPSKERLQAAKSLTNGLVAGTQLAAGLNPVINASEAVTGKDTVTGESLGFFGRILSFFGVIDEPIKEVGTVVKDAKLLNDAARDTARVTVEESAEESIIEKEIIVDKAKHPEAAQHIEDAQASGHPDVLTANRPGTDANRAAATGGVAKMPGKQLDEYPPAMFKEGGRGASVRPINPADNMGAGAAIGNQMRNVPDGSKVRIKVIDSGTPSS